MDRAHPDYFFLLLFHHRKEPSFQGLFDYKSVIVEGWSDRDSRSLTIARAVPGAARGAARVCEVSADQPGMVTLQGGCEMNPPRLSHSRALQLGVHLLRSSMKSKIAHQQGTDRPRLVSDKSQEILSPTILAARKRLGWTWESGSSTPLCQSQGGSVALPLPGMLQ